jgi:hypothetical protein
MQSNRTGRFFGTVNRPVPCERSRSVLIACREAGRLLQRAAWRLESGDIEHMAASGGPARLLVCCFGIGTLHVWCSARELVDF